MSGAPGSAPQRPAAQSLWTFEFLALCAISILAFCNISIFYSFYDYLGELGVDPHWRGILLALEPFTAFVIRPFLGHLLTLHNGVRLMRMGLILATVSLLCYPLARTLPLLALVRVMHGVGFVTLVSGVMGTIAGMLPREKSAQGFGLISVTVLLPYAIMPAFAELLLPYLSSHGAVYAVAAPLMLPAFLLLIPLDRRVRARAALLPPGETARPGRQEIAQGLKNGPVVLLALANLCLVAGHSIVFFFMREFALTVGLGNPGVFFTCANGVIILLRVAMGGMLDRLNQGLLLTLAFVELGALVPALSLAGGGGQLLFMAGFYGLGMAFTMPLLNAMMLHLSTPRLRAFNNNLLMIGVDAGFFAGPLLGGALFAAGWTHAGLFAAAGATLVLGALLVQPAARRLNNPVQPPPDQP